MRSSRRRPRPRCTRCGSTASGWATPARSASLRRSQRRRTPTSSRSISTPTRLRAPRRRGRPSPTFWSTRPLARCRHAPLCATLAVTQTQRSGQHALLACRRSTTSSDLEPKRSGQHALLACR
eukprot:7380408-Prymnesium_polylepis.1